MELVETSYFDTIDEETVEQWSVFHYREDQERLFQSPAFCKRRDGGTWKNVSSTEVIRKEVFFWLMENIGINDDTWECDRVYYPDEPLPELPRGGYGAWVQKFECYADRGYRPGRWTHQDCYVNRPRARGMFTFKSRADAMFFMLRWSS